MPRPLENFAIWLSDAPNYPAGNDEGFTLAVKPDSPTNLLGKKVLRGSVVLKFINLDFEPRSLFILGHHQLPDSHIYAPPSFRNGISQYPALVLHVPRLGPHHLNLGLRRTRTCQGCFSGFLGLGRLVGDNQEGQENGPGCNSIGPRKNSIPTWQVPCGVICTFIAVFMVSRWGDRAGVELTAFLLILVAGFLILTGYIDGPSEDYQDHNRILPQKQSFQHNSAIVPHKYLDSL